MAAINNKDNNLRIVSLLNRIYTSLVPATTGRSELLDPILDFPLSLAEHHKWNIQLDYIYV
jgi:hypothetical protein